MTSTHTDTAAAVSDSYSSEESATPAKRPKKTSQSTAETADTSTASGTNVRWSDQIPHNQRYTDEQVKHSKTTLRVAK